MKLVVAKKSSMRRVPAEFHDVVSELAGNVPFATATRGLAKMLSDHPRLARKYVGGFVKW